MHVPPIDFLNHPCLITYIANLEVQAMYMELFRLICPSGTCVGTIDCQ
jgi:hypothetical protein